MSAKDRILECLAGKNVDGILEQFQTTAARPKATELKEAFELLDRAQSTDLWNFIYTERKEHIEGLCSSLESGADAATLELGSLRAILQAVLCFCQACKFKPAALFDLINTAQGVLGSTDMSPSLLAVKLLLSKVSEYWWLSNEQGAEMLVPQLLQHLLLCCLDISGHDTDIKRLFSLRAGLLLLDLEHVSAEQTKGLLLRCFAHPSFLRLGEGQRFLAFLLTLNEGLLLEQVCQIMRAQAASGSRSVAAAYGDVLQRAWRDCVSLSAEGDAAEGAVGQMQGQGQMQGGGSGGVTAKLLEDAVQIFLRDAVHAQEGRYFAGLRALLRGCHDVRRSKEVDAMLLRVYDPILWRSLRCAHAQVRDQAAVLFMDVFPLQHSDGRAEADDRILQKQFDLLSALLTDADHTVRAHAASGVCHILREYWEALPLATTHNILRFLVDTLAQDASCANVRYAVFAGLGELFEQPLAHSLLKQLLPLLRNSIHDRAEKVRVAFVRILCQIKGIRGMHFYDVVTVEHLLERLALDRGRKNMCLAMGELLLNSFLPQGAGEGGGSVESQQLTRCIKFIESNPLAATTFYSTLPQLVSAGACAKVVAVLVSYLVSAEQRRLDAREADGEAEGAGKGGKGKRRREGLSPALPAAIKLGLLRVAVCLLDGLVGVLSIQKPARELLLQYLPEATTQLLMRSCSQPVVSSDLSVHLLPLAFRVSAAAVAMRRMASTSTSVVHSLLLDTYGGAWEGAAGADATTATASAMAATADCTRSSLARAAVQCVGVEQLLAVVLAAVEALQVRQGKGKKATRKGAVSGAGTGAVLSLGAAVDLLAALEEAGTGDSSSLMGVFASLQSLCAQIASGGGEVVAAAKGLRVWVAHCVRRDAAAELEAGTGAVGACVGSVLEWVDDHLLPHLTQAQGTGGAELLLSMLLACCGDMVYLDMHDERLVGALAGWMRALSTSTSSASTCACLSPLLRLSSLLNQNQRTVNGAGSLCAQTLSLLCNALDSPTSTYKEEGRGGALLPLLLGRHPEVLSVALARIALELSLQPMQEGFGGGGAVLLDSPSGTLLWESLSGGGAGAGAKGLKEVRAGARAAIAALLGGEGEMGGIGEAGVFSGGEGARALTRLDALLHTADDADVDTDADAADPEIEAEGTEMETETGVSKRPKHPPLLDTSDQENTTSTRNMVGAHVQTRVALDV